MKFGMYVEVDEWCTTICSMTLSKVKVKVTSFKLENPSIFKSYLIRRLQWELASDQWLLKGKMSKFGRAGGLFLCHVTLKLAETSVVKSQPSVPHWANLLKC